MPFQPGRRRKVENLCFLFNSLSGYWWLCPAPSSFPCQGKAKYLLAPQPLSAGHFSSQMYHEGSCSRDQQCCSLLALSSWPKGGQVAKRLSEHPALVDTSHSLRPFCSYGDNATPISTMLAETTTSGHRAGWRVGTVSWKGVRGYAGPALLQDALLKPGSVVGKERGPTLLAYIQELRKWLLSAAQWWQCLETATQVTHWIKWEKPIYNNTNKWQEKPSFLYSPLKKHWRVLKTPNVCPQIQINIKSVPSRCLPNSLQEVLRTEVFYPAWWGYAQKLRF